MVDESAPADISKTARIACILQLCVAFSVLLWILGAPFTEALYENKKTLTELEWITIEHSEMFKNLPQERQEQIIAIQQRAQQGLQETFRQKIVKSVEGLFLGIPVSKIIWLILALILPIMVMKQVEGSREVFWLLPILAIVYTWQMLPLQIPTSIYPTESYLESKYMSAPLSGSIDMQKNNLELAWKAYIVAEWSKAPAYATNAEKFADGLYHFIVQKTLVEHGQPEPKPGPWTLMSYIAWNFLAAWAVSRK
jgi:hypothetical protein